MLAEKDHTIVAFFEDNELVYQELVFNLHGNKIPMFRAKETHHIAVTFSLL